MKKIILSTIITITAFFAFSAPKTQKLIVDKITTQHFNLHNIKKDNIDANGVINYSVKKNNWPTYIFDSKKGVLKNGTSYKLDFEVKVKGEFSKEKFFEFLVRADDQEHDWWTDLAVVHRYRAPDGGFQKVSVRFELPQDGRNYALRFSAKLADIELRNLKLYEASYLQEFPITKDSTSEKVDLSDIPTGAKEFEVDLPRPAKTIVVNAHDFGLSESSTENHIAIRKAIEHCKKIGASKLTMKKGVYKCFGEDAGAFRFIGFKDFTFDGNGSTFIFRRVKPVETFGIYRCERVRLYNFDLDWDWETDPLASLATIINVGEEVVDGKKERFFDLEFTEYQNDTHPRYNKYIRIAHMSEYDTKRKAVGVEKSRDASFGYLEHVKGPKTKWLDKNKLRIYSWHYTAKRIGGHYRVQHWYYHSDAFRFADTSHLTFDRVNIRATRGAAFYGFPNCSYVQIRNCKIAPKNLYRRPQTCTADHCYITMPKGYIKVENCEFSRGGDDCINFHGPITYTQKVDDYSMRMITMKAHKYFKKGETIELFDAHFVPFNKKMKIKDVRETKEYKELVFEEKIPQQREGGYVLLIPQYKSANVIIRNSKFHSNRARGLLIMMNDVTIENCHIHDVEMAGMRLETGYAVVWSEGTLANNIVVRNCTFESNNAKGITQLDGYESDIIMGAFMTAYRSGEHPKGFVVNRVLFENNTFKNSYGMIARIISSNNVIFRDNKIINNVKRVVARDYRSCFYVKKSQNIKILNNTWIDSELVKTPRVFVDTTTSKNVVIQGNKIEK